MMTTAARTQTPAEPDSGYRLSADQISSFRANGFIHLRDVLGPERLALYRAEIGAKVREFSAGIAPLADRDTYGKAFLQVMNLWRDSDLVRQFVFDTRLARIAAELLEVAGVRLYHDQALFKEPGGGITPWHADQHYWPLSSDRAITAWIPLAAVSLDMGPLAFCPGSQRLQDGRDLEISDESEATLARKLELYGVVEEPFAAGDVSFHLGWTFHRADANATSTVREAFTIIYLDQEMRLAQPRNKNQATDWERWCPGVQISQVISSELNPVLYRGDV
jgi:ectoine hydroxylase-related dioxygenase (phytanoyl-CoA dioxygenase family)